MVSRGTAVLSSVLNIVARLEHDRQDTQVCLDQQQVKSHDLNSDLEREDEQRQDMLLEFVQAGGCGGFMAAAGLGLMMCMISSLIRTRSMCSGYKGTEMAYQF